MIISPGLASTALPSTVMFTTSVLLAVSVIRARPVLDVHEELVAEHAERRHDRGRDRRAEEADRGHRRRPGERPLHAGHDVVAHVDEQVEVLHAACALLDAVHHLLEPAAAL